MRAAWPLVGGCRIGGASNPRRFGCRDIESGGGPQSKRALSFGWCPAPVNGGAPIPHRHGRGRGTRRGTRCGSERKIWETLGCRPEERRRWPAERGCTVKPVFHGVRHRCSRMPRAAHHAVILSLVSRGLVRARDKGLCRQPRGGATRAHEPRNARDIGSPDPSLGHHLPARGRPG